MANYFGRLISNKDVREAIALTLIGIVLLILAYLVAAFAVSHMHAPFGSFEEFVKPRQHDYAAQILYTQFFRQTWNFASSGGIGY